MVVSADNRGISVDPDRVKRKIGLKLFTLERDHRTAHGVFCIVSRQLIIPLGITFINKQARGWFCIPGIQCVLILDYRVIHVLLLSSNLTVCGYLNVPPDCSGELSFCAADDEAARALNRKEGMMP